MQRVAFLVLVAFTVLAAATTTADFDAWTARHGKQYSTEAERTRRFGIFKANSDLIARHNAEADQGKHSFRLEANKFADLTNAEYRAAYLKLRPSNDIKKRSIALRDNKHFTHNVAALPTSVDWRTKGAVNAVKDQGQCGSCWSFSATTAMETAWFLKSGKLLSLSEQMCVDCVNGGADDCNSGGEMHDCYLQVIKQGGDELESDYPYTATSSGKCRYDPSKAVTKFASYYNISQYNETALAVAAAQTVVSVGIDASSDAFQFYSSGVYDQSDCKWKWDELDHGVAVVGYGALNGTPYWIVRNSWGPSWGMQGYILMSKDKKNQCGIATDATVPVPA